MSATSFRYKSVSNRDLGDNSSGGNEMPDSNPEKSKVLKPVLKKEKDMLTVIDKNKVLTYLNILQKEISDSFQQPVGLDVFVLPYSHGIILEIKYTSFDQITIRFGKFVAEIKEAFGLLNLRIENYLSEELLIEFNASSDKEKSQFFSGTNLLYTSDKFYIIKEFADNCWSQHAAKNDVKRMKRDAAKLAMA